MQTPDRLETFLALTMKIDGLFVQENEPSGSFAGIEDIAGGDKVLDSPLNLLSDTELDKLNRNLTDLAEKTTSGQRIWFKDILESIGNDICLIDEKVNTSRISYELEKETEPMQEMIRTLLASDQVEDIEPEVKNDSGMTKAELRQRPISEIRRGICHEFSRRFVSFYDIKSPAAFDGLDLMRTSLLARMLGAREAALACCRIETIGLKNTLLRRLSVEQGRAVLIQLNTPERSQPADNRLDFSENMVKLCIKTSRIMTNSVDKLGWWLIKLYLLNCTENQSKYFEQKFPIQTNFNLPAEISAFLKTTSPATWTAIIKEVERTSEFLKTHSENNC